jgi:Uncharacterized protein conserved in bacteria
MEYQIKKQIISLKGTGKFHKELNLISWNGHEPIYDLRGWNEDHTEMTKGVTLSKEELIELKSKLLEVEE